MYASCNIISHDKISIVVVLYKIDFGIRRDSMNLEVLEDHAPLRDRLSHGHYRAIYIYSDTLLYGYHGTLIDIHA
mgnify:CR=1 FL=1